MSKDFLRSVGSVIEKADLPTDLVTGESHEEFNLRFEKNLLGKKPKPSLIIGGNGVGKTALINSTAANLHAKGWFVFRASASDLMAHQKYIGELEGRVKDVVESLMAIKKHLWIIPDFHELLYTGKYNDHPIGALDYLMPYMEKEKLHIIAECSDAAFERLIQARPRISTLMEVLRLDPCPPEAALYMAEQWAKQPLKAAVWGKAEQPLLEEALALSSQFLTHHQLPGNLFHFLKQTEAHILLERSTGRPVQLADLYQSLCRITGIPVHILDHKVKLDIGKTLEEFQSKVLGQEEAVQVLVERIAMIKAGLTDPTRPYGVFLFVGPTGTGKTEIAKTLAAYLFGSKDRMIRLDMSEFQTADSLSRLIGDPGYSEASALVNQIRKQPFSVLLLDEFEKAHSKIWDLFLQIFDDGRLTDASGNLANFRHAIIILTSNLGAAKPRMTPVGFKADEQEAPSMDADIRESITYTFRPEFINRLDKVVTFRPLNKSVMRKILQLELNNILNRRGFLQNDWSMEWEDAALEFLLEVGFDPKMGARPLKRAIEQYLLAPLAMTIVSHDIPTSYQFLFIRRSGDKLAVDFIDPEAPKVHWKERKSQEQKQLKKAEALSLKDVIRGAKGELAEFKLVEKEFQELEKHLHRKKWDKAKAALMEQMGEPGFWDSPERLGVLSEIEYRDRVEAAMDTCHSLMERLEACIDNPQLSFPPELLQRLAQKIWLLDRSIRDFRDRLPQAVFLQILPSEGEDDANLEKLGNMYRKWCRKRKMSLKVLQEKGEVLLAISGFGAYSLLKDETGLHLWEHAAQKKKTVRQSFKVTVVPQPEGAPEEALATEAGAALKKHTGILTIVRKYRTGNTTSVKDMVQGWKTVRLDEVLGGDFDLFGVSEGEGEGEGEVR